jgi:hypothetical protein
MFTWDYSVTGKFIIILNFIHFFYLEHVLAVGVVEEFILEEQFSHYV